MEILRKDNPLKRRGLSLAQRISYFTSAAYVLEYLPKAVYLAMPPIALDGLILRTLSISGSAHSEQLEDH